MTVELTDPEDRKIVTLARSALARAAGSASGACLRDTDGRTYGGAAVALPHLTLSAVGVAVAMAVSSGAPGVEAVAVASAATELDPGDVAIVRDLGGPDVPVWLVDPRGVVRSVTRT